MANNGKNKKIAYTVSGRAKSRAFIALLSIQAYMLLLFNYYCSFFWCSFKYGLCVLCLVVLV